MNSISTKLKTGDEVIVIAGKDIGKKGTLRQILKAKNRGIVEQEAPINLSNLAIWNPKSKSKDKIKVSEDKNGKKIRLFKSDNKEIK